MGSFENYNKIAGKYTIRNGVSKIKLQKIKVNIYYIYLVKKRMIFAHNFNSIKKHVHD